MRLHPGSSGDGTAETKHDLIRIIESNEASLQKLGVCRLGLFGSFVRGEQGDDSDVDLSVEFAPGQATFDHFMGLAFLCEDLLGRRVEIVTPNSLSPHLGPSILRDVEFVLG